MRAPQWFRVFATAIALLAPASLQAGNGLEIVQTAAAPCAQNGSGYVIVTSPDGQYVYEGGYDASTTYGGLVRVSARNASTGVLTPVQFLSSTPVPFGQSGVVSEIAPSPGWDHLYVGAGRLEVFARDAGSGLLTFVESHPAAGSIVVSPDGAHVYAHVDNTLTVFDRNPTTGGLTQAIQYPATSYVESIAVSPDGAHVYVADQFLSRVAIYDRDAGTGALTFKAATSPAYGHLLITPDGTNLYVIRPSFRLYAFARDTGTGLLTLIDTETEGDPGLPATWRLTGAALGPGGTDLYVSGEPFVAFSRSLVDGSLTFLEQHADGVAGADGLATVEDVAAPADGTHVYTIGEGTVTFARATPGGALTFAARTETEGKGMAVAVAPDGAHAYRLCHRAIDVFGRNAPDGHLSPASSLALDSLDAARGLAVPSDGEHLYVSHWGPSSFATNDRLIVLDRSPSTGALTPVTEYTSATFGAGFRSVAFSPDGLQLYAGSASTLLVLSRDPGTGLLTLADTELDGLGGVPAGALEAMTDVVVSPDGRHVYVSSHGSPESSDGFAIFSRDPGTGALTFTSMFTVNGGGGGSLEGIYGMALSADGSTLHATGIFARGGVGGVSNYTRDPLTGALSFTSSLREGTEAAGTLDSPGPLDIDPAGTHVYASGLGGIHVLRRDPALGALGFVETATGALSYFAADSDGVVALSPGGEQLYAVEEDGDVVVFARRAVCPPTAAPGCLPADASALKIGEKVGPSDLVAWKWRVSGAIDVGDPQATTELAVCVYDGSGAPQPILSSVVEPGGTCGTKPCWTVVAAGYKYVDKMGAPDGVTKIRLLTDGTVSAKIVLKGKGASLPPLGLPYVTPVTFQLQASNGECWEATYAAPVFNDVTQFKATE